MGLARDERLELHVAPDERVRVSAHGDATGLCVLEGQSHDGRGDNLIDRKALRGRGRGDRWQGG